MHFLADLIFLLGLMLLSLTDIKRGILPDRLNLFLAVFGVLFTYLGALQPYDSAAIGAGLALAFLGFLHFISGGGLGCGDVKLGFVLGIWLGHEYIIVALIIAFLAGGIFAALLLLSKKVSRKDPIPFGPFLAFGATVAMLWGNALVAWYLALFNG